MGDAVNDAGERPLSAHDRRTATRLQRAADARMRRRRAALHLLRLLDSPPKWYSARSWAYDVSPFIREAAEALLDADPRVPESLRLLAEKIGVTTTRKA